MKIVVCERGIRILFHNLEAAASAVVWRKVQLLSSERSFSCGVTVARRTMATPQQEAQVVVWYAETKLFITALRNYRWVCGSDAPDTKTIKAWFVKFLAMGSALKQSGGTCWSVSEKKVKEIHTVFQRSPSKSIRQALKELYVPRTTVHWVLHKQLRLFAYKVQVTQELKPDDKPKWLDFTIDMLYRIDMDPGFLLSMLFSDEATFHQSGKVSWYNACICSSENPHIHREVVQDSPEVYVWCGLMKDRIIGPFFFVEATVTGGFTLTCWNSLCAPR
jgi:hypothetical protein